MTARLNSRTETDNSKPLVLIAGGASFIGTALIEILLKEGLKVICLDNLSTGKKENLQKFFQNPDFTFLENNLNESNKINDLSPDYIFHLAGVEEYINGVDVSLDTLLVNSLGTKNLLDLAVKNRSKFLLVSSLSVYEGLLSGNSLKNDFGLSQKDMQKYTHHEAKRFSEALVVEYFRKNNLDARVIRIKDCYGPQMSLEEGSPISRLIKQVVKKENLTIEGDGLEILFPTYIEDVVFGLQKSMFSQNTSGKIYTLVNSKEYSLINLAYSVQKIINPNLKIEFLPEKKDFKFPKKPPEIEQTKKDLNWSPKTSWEEGLLKTINSFKNPDENSQESKTTKENIFFENKTIVETEVIPKPKIQTIVKAENKEAVYETPIKQKKKIKLPSLKPKFITLFLSFLLLTIVLTFPILSLGMQTFLGAKNMDTAKKDLENGKIEESIKKSEKAEKNFFLAKKTTSNLLWFFTIIKLRKEISLLSETLEVGENLASGLKHVGISVKMLKNIKDDLVLGFAPNTEEKITESVLELELADEKLALVQALVGDKSPCPFNNYFCEKTNSIIKEIPKERDLLFKAKNIISAVPQILGSNSKKTYLILLQNNMEIRGSGGFIGSYALVVFENGKILETKIEDIYSIDGQLKGKITPPDEVLHYLGQPNWYLRDSNINSDFALTGKRAIWFFEKETGILVDGVVAIDLSFAEEILKVVGPVFLPDYKIKLTADNLFLEAEKNSETNFFPGSTQKKDFLGSFGRALLTELQTKGDKNIIPILKKTSQAVEKKHLQIYFSDNNTQELIKTIKASGEIEQDFCESQKPCIKNALFISENNFGANKANYFLKRKIARETTIGREGEIKESLVINYQNDSPSESWPAGTYKNYLKIYAPLNSKLLSIDLGDNKKATISAVLNGDVIKNIAKNEFLVTESSESGKTTWASLVEVSYKSKKTIKISFQTPQKINFNNKDFTLEFYQQKQAGTINDAFEQIVAYPAFLSVISTEPKEGIVKEPVVSYNTDLSTDKNLLIKFKVN